MRSVAENTIDSIKYADGTTCFRVDGDVVLTLTTQMKQQETESIEGLIEVICGMFPDCECDEEKEYKAGYLQGYQDKSDDLAPVA